MAQRLCLLESTDDPAQVVENGFETSLLSLRRIKVLGKGHKHDRDNRRYLADKSPA